MKMYPRAGDKRRYDDIDVEDEEEAAIGSLCRLSGGHPTSPVCAMENEKRIRREIANSNERRRMQSINAGFASLKQLLPNHEGEKLSKAAILQQTAEYIYRLEDEKKQLMSQNIKLRKILQQHESTDGSSSESEQSPLNEIISTLQDLQNNPGAQSKLPNTEFHHKIRRSTTELPPSAPEDVAAVEEVALEEVKDEYSTENPQQTMVQIKMDLDRDKKLRTRIQDKMKSLVFSSKKQQVEYTEESIVKAEPMEYTTYTLTKSNNSPIHTTTISQQQQHHHLPPPPNTRCYINTSTITAAKHPSPTTAYVTILPSTPPHLQQTSAPITVPTTLPKVSSNRIPQQPVVEVVCSSDGEVICPRVQVEPTSRIPTPDQIEYLTAEGSPTHQTLALSSHDGGSISSANLVNKTGNGQSCQKSLDTICEAIRHLEGEHMFSNSAPQTSEVQQHVVDGRMEEEQEQQIITTEDTYTIQEGDERSVIIPSYIETSGLPHDNIVRRTKVLEICSSAASSPLSGGRSPQQHQPQHAALQLHASNVIYGIDKHLVSCEPQEMPLELTTNHRIERISASSPPPAMSTTHAFSSSNFMQASRPGVIVVKQA